MGKAFEKQTKTIKDQGKKNLKPKEIEAIEETSDDNEKHLKYKWVFHELSNKRIGEIYDIGKKMTLII